MQWGAKKLFLVGHVQQNLRSFVSKSFETFFARYVFWLSCYAPSQHLNYRIELDLELDLFLENQNLCSSSWSFGEVWQKGFSKIWTKLQLPLWSPINILNLGKEWLVVHWWHEKISIWIKSSQIYGFARSVFFGRGTEAETVFAFCLLFLTFFLNVISFWKLCQILTNSK